MFCQALEIHRDARGDTNVSFARPMAWPTGANSRFRLIFSKNGPFPASFYFRLFCKQLIVNNCSIKVGRLLDSNQSPLVS